LSPYNLEKKIQFLPNGFYNLKVRVCDDVENCKTETVEFNFKLENNNPLPLKELLITNPQEGAIISNTGFPLGIATVVDNPDQITKLSFYYLDEKNNKILITSLENDNIKKLSTRWEKIPPSGFYKIYGEAFLWSGEIIKSKEISIIINNTEKD
jgi:hypothetical protein